MLFSVPTIRIRISRPAAYSSLCWLRMFRPAVDSSTGTGPAGAPLVARAGASAAAGNAGAGVVAVSAAYCGGSAITTGIWMPWPEVPWVSEMAAKR